MTQNADSIDSNQRIIDLCTEVLSRVEKEYNLRIPNKAIARARIVVNGTKKNLWFVNREPQGDFRQVPDFTGTSPVLVAQGHDVLNEDGEIIIYKNSPVGGVVAMHDTGKHIVNLPGGTKGHISKVEVDIIEKTNYRPLQNGSDGVDCSMHLNNSTRAIRFRSAVEHRQAIRESLERVETIRRELQEADEQIRLIPEDERKLKILQLERAMAEAEARGSELRAKQDSFIRDQQKLRLQPILDPVQERIKRSRLFDGVTVVIDGGPGTGKTTTLIQRIKFLTARSLAEYNLDIESEQLALVTDDRNNKSWMFFSPSELLRDYLSDNMAEEGLRASQSTVFVWDYYLRDQMRLYGLLNKQDFRLLGRQNNEGIEFRDIFFSNDVAEIRKVYGRFWEILLQRLNGRFDSFRSFKCTDPQLCRYQSLILNQYDQKRPRSLLEFIQVYRTIKDLYNPELQRQLAAYQFRYQELVLDFQVNLSSSQQAWLNKLVLDDEEISNETRITKVNEFLKEAIRAVIRSRRTDHRLTQRQEQVAKYFAAEFESIDSGLIDWIAFDSSFMALTQGVATNVWSGIVGAFKVLRNEDVYKSVLRQQGVSQLEKMLKKGTTLIHPEEASLIIKIINSAIRTYARAYTAEFEETAESEGHAFIIGFRNAVRPVIAIDEATDFSLVQLLAMHSFRHHRISSVSYCGDLLQRLTTSGIRKWEDLDSFISRSKQATGSLVDVQPMRTSYRQGEKLLNVAKEIYKKVTGHSPAYESYLKNAEHEPDPLFHSGGDETSRVEWVAERIGEINEKYLRFSERLPTIAVFVASEEEVVPLAVALQERDALTNQGILVEACERGRVLGHRSAVRVFSVEHVKGLEFEAVFFHNIDHIYKVTGWQELVDRYLYVGVSRAAYYLALTSSRGWPERAAYLSSIFSENGNWK